MCLLILDQLYFRREERRENLNAENMILPDVDYDAHGRQWRLFAPDVADEHLIFFTGSTRINWSNGGVPPPVDKTFLKYFELFFGFENFNNMIRWTNVRLSKKNRTPTNLGEVQRYLGIMLVMCLEPIKGSKFDAYFSKKQEEGVASRPGDYEYRFKMKYNRFRDIQSYFRVCQHNSSVSTITVFC
jgi:hypothetical protein